MHKGCSDPSLYEVVNDVDYMQLHHKKPRKSLLDQLNTHVLLLVTQVPFIFDALQLG